MPTGRNDSQTTYEPLDIGDDIFEWQSAAEIAILIGVEGEPAKVCARVSTAAAQGFRCNGYTIERREIGDRDRKRYPRGNWLYRAAKDPHRPRPKANGAVSPSSPTPGPAEPQESSEAAGGNPHSTVTNGKSPDVEALLEEREGLLEQLEALRDDACLAVAELEDKVTELEDQLRLERTSPPAADLELVAEVTFLREALWSIALGEPDDYRLFAGRQLRKSYRGGIE